MVGLRVTALVRAIANVVADDCATELQDLGREEQPEEARIALAPLASLARTGSERDQRRADESPARPPLSNEGARCDEPDHGGGDRDVLPADSSLPLFATRRP